MLSWQPQAPLPLHSLCLAPWPPPRRSHACSSAMLQEGLFFSAQQGHLLFKPAWSMSQAHKHSESWTTVSEPSMWGLAPRHCSMLQHVSAADGKHISAWGFHAPPLHPHLLPPPPKPHTYVMYVRMTATTMHMGQIVCSVSPPLVGSRERGNMDLALDLTHL